MGTNDSLQGLVELFQCESAKAHNYMGVAVQIENAEAPEIIIISKVNFESKVAYYQNAYNENLQLKANPKICIIGYSLALCFDDLEDLESWIH